MEGFPTNSLGFNDKLYIFLYLKSIVEKNVSGGWGYTHFQILRYPPYSLFYPVIGPTNRNLNITGNYVFILYTVWQQKQSLPLNQK
jgi:hypothetical protein